MISNLQANGESERAAKPVDGPWNIRVLKHRNDGAGWHGTVGEHADNLTSGAVVVVLFNQ